MLGRQNLLPLGLSEKIPDVVSPRTVSPRIEFPRTVSLRVISPNPMIMSESTVTSKIRGGKSSGYYSFSSRNSSTPSSSQPVCSKNQPGNQQIRKRAMSVSPGTATNSTSKAKFA